MTQISPYYSLMGNLLGQGLNAVIENFDDDSLLQSSAALGVSLAGVAHFGLKVYENIG